MSKRRRTKPFDPRDALGAVFAKIEILSPVQFSFAGEAAVDARAFAQPPQQAPAWAAPASVGEDLLAKALQATLYERCYAQRMAPPQGAAADPAFASSLAAANTGRERWDRGWVIQQFGHNGQAFVRKGDCERAAAPGTYIIEGAPGVSAQIGASVSLRAPSDSFGVQPGYYFAFGETLDELADQLSLVRVYFHCPAKHAAALVQALTTQLNRFQTPFQFKTPAAPTLYERADAAVLYVGQRYFSIVARLVELIQKSIELEPATPLFTKELWPGVGVAVEPGTGESFGSHRCRLVAEGVVDAWRQGEQSAIARLAAVTTRFAGAGLDLARPWLGPTGVDPFERPQIVRLP